MIEASLEEKIRAKSVNDGSFSPLIRKTRGFILISAAWKCYIFPASSKCVLYKPIRMNTKYI